MTTLDLLNFADMPDQAGDTMHARWLQIPHGCCGWLFCGLECALFQNRYLLGLRSLSLGRSGSEGLFFIDE